MPQPDSTAMTEGHGATGTGRKQYQPPTLSAYGTVRDLTLTNATGPAIDGGAGGDIYTS